MTLVKNSWSVWGHTFSPNKTSYHKMNHDWTKQNILLHAHLDVSFHRPKTNWKLHLFKISNFCTWMQIFLSQEEIKSCWVQVSCRVKTDVFQGHSIIRAGLEEGHKYDPRTAPPLLWKQSWEIWSSAWRREVSRETPEQRYSIWRGPPGQLDRNLLQRHIES